MNKLLFIIASLVSLNVLAETTTLKCLTDQGQNTADITVDINNKILNFGQTKYNITHVNDTYISAYESPYSVGGEVLVINRLSGEYKRAMIKIFVNAALENPKDQSWLDAATYSGTCKKQQF